jgi:hypothetical protein
MIQIYDETGRRTDHTHGGRWLTPTDALAELQRRGTPLPQIEDPNDPMESAWKLYLALGHPDPFQP